MSHKIRLDVKTLSGHSFKYEIDSGMSILEFIHHVISTHPFFADVSRFNRSAINIEQTQLLFNGRKLEHRKSFEEYMEFQVKSDSEFKIHIIPKGGEVDSLSNSIAEISTPLMKPYAYQSPVLGALSTSPIHIKPMNLGGRSQPGSYSNSFLESQINRMDRMDREFKSRSDTVSETVSLGDLSDKIDRLQNRIDQIYEMINSLNLNSTTQ